jgi:uncharacterized protein with GYD domain
MPKYMVVASYTADGFRGLKKTGGSARVEAVRASIEGLGGTLESFHFAFGEGDAYVIADLPDNASASALALAVAETGLVNLRTVPLITPEEIDRAAQMAVQYRPPGS